jgi:hypothetical protein
MRLAILLFFALPAAATVVTLERDGAPVAGEVCRFAAGGRENPFERWLRSQEVTCVAAGSAMDLPPGFWNVFGKSGRFVSRETVLVNGEIEPEKLTLTLVPSATIAPLLKPGQSALVYIPRRATARPASEPVPAGEELWFLVLEKAAPVLILPVPALEAGTNRTIDARGAGLTAILGWLQVAGADQAAILTAGGVSSPRVRVTSAGPSIDADPLPSIDSLNGAFVLFRGVSAGEAELEVGGRGWLTDRRRVQVGASSVTRVTAPLRVRAAASLVIHWLAGRNVPELERSLEACSSTARPVALYELTLSSCPRPEKPREPVDPKACQDVRRETFSAQPSFGHLTVDDIAPGYYRAEVRFGRLPPIFTMVEAVRLQQRSATVNVDYVELYGSLTLGDQALAKDASIQFPFGVGFASAETGEYRAALIDVGSRMAMVAQTSPDLYELLDTDSEIQVATCDGSLRALTLAEHAARRNARFNIDIPDNALIVRVTDTFTRRPLNGVMVSVVMMDKLDRRPILTRSLKTEEGGEATMKHVPERQLHISLSLAGYEKSSVESFTMPRNGEKVVEAQLVPLRGNSARVVSPRPFESGMVFWYAPDGRETEHADLAPDGTFIYAGMHEPVETMAVVSLSHPLWVTRSPAIGSRSSEAPAIRFPDAPARAFEVTIPEARHFQHIGLVIGGIRVPQPVLQMHQTLRSLRPVISDSSPLHFRDILETGPIDVLRGPLTTEVTNPGSFDFLALPRFADLPRQRLLPGAAGVVFE